MISIKWKCKIPHEMENIDFCLFFIFFLLLFNITNYCDENEIQFVFIENTKTKIYTVQKQLYKYTNHK